MFGLNKIVGPKDYKNQEPNTLTVTTIFYTLQGEGRFAGETAVFVRFTGCNRTCSFCDTFFDSGDVMTFQEILDVAHSRVLDFALKQQIEASSLFDNLLFVITGGEPQLQPNLGSFLEFLHTKGYRTQIESNGDFLRSIPDKTVLTVSPKCNKKTGKYGMIRDDVFDRADVLKFVVSADITSPYHLVPDYAHEFRRIKGPRSVFVSPMNMYQTFPKRVGADGSLHERSEVDERISFWTPNLLDYQKNQANHEYAALLAMKHNFTLNLQTHLYASLP
jgi:organic radical activating enzyme